MEPTSELKTESIDNGLNLNNCMHNDSNEIWYSFRRGQIRNTKLVFNMSTWAKPRSTLQYSP